MTPATGSLRKLPEFWRYPFLAACVGFFSEKVNHNDNNFFSAEYLRYYCPRFVSFDTSPLPDKNTKGRLVEVCEMLTNHVFTIYICRHKYAANLYIFFLASILYLSYCLLFVVFYTYCPLGTIVQWKKSLGPYAICKVLQIPNENNCKLFVSWGRCTLTQHPKAFKNLPGYEK